MTTARRPLLALDLGGVLFGVRPLNIALSERHAERPSKFSNAELDRAFFFGQAHRLVCCGEMKEADWFARIADRLSLPPDAVRRAWRARPFLLEGATELLSFLCPTLSPTIAVKEDGDSEDGETECPFDIVVWSNIDAVHWQEVSRWLPKSWQTKERRALSFELGALKPDPRFYASALARLEQPPALFLDDHEKNLHAARRLGLTSKCAPSPREALAILRDFRLRQFNLREFNPSGV